MIKPLEDATSASYHDFLDFEIVDKNNASVGTLFSMWSDQKTGKFEFMGFKTGWLLGKNHIMPVTGVTVDEEKKVIQVPYTNEFLKDAPVFSEAAEITEEHEREVRDHYKDAPRGD